MTGARGAAGLAMLMLAFTALARLGTGLYLPALAGDLELSAGQAAFTFTVYLIGFAVAAVLLGPLADCWGRRLLIRGGTALFLAGSLCCAFTDHYPLLVAGRLLQAVGGGVISVAARAMVLDAYSAERLVSVLGWMGTVGGLVPVLAPAVGGVVTEAFGWRANFDLLAAAALVLAWLGVTRLPETLPEPDRVPFSPAEAARTYGLMLRSKEFVLPLIPALLCFALQGAFLVALPFVMIELLGMPPILFGATTLLLVGALALGRLMCLHVLRRWGAFAGFLSGAVLVFASGDVFVALLATEAAAGATVLVPVSIFFLGFGALLPLTMKAGMGAFPERAGTASALFGALTLAAGAAGSGLVGGMLERRLEDVHLLGVVTLATGGLVLAAGLACRKLDAWRMEDGGRRPQAQTASHATTP